MMLRNPEVSKEIIARKYKYIFQGYHELDFPFPEIEETFHDIKNAAAQQLQEINNILENLVQSSSDNTHHKYFIEALHTIKNQFSIISHMESLAQGVMVECNQSQKLMQYPYGRCINICAEYVELSDLLYRTIERFNKFGPDKPYFDDAILSTHSQKEGFQAYLDILEKQDYVTAFNKILTNEQSSKKYHLMLLAKENEYQF